MLEPGESINEIATIIKEAGSRPSSFRKRWPWVIGLSVLLIISLTSPVLLSTSSTETKYRTQLIERDSFVVTVTATGKLEPVEEVEIGTEVSGTIETVYVDYNQQVSKGELLAKLDTDTLEAKVLQSEATLEAAQANLVEAEAAISESSAEVRKLQRLYKLSGGKMPSRQDLDTAATAVKVAEAKKLSAAAQIKLAEASLSIDRTNLEKAEIRSPIDGIVLQREVESGQTVAASLTTPVLFTIAENLTQMELHVDVDEADVGEVKEKQRAVFTVDAFPHRTFPAEITQVRYSPVSVEGVVTYETVLQVDNSDLLLRPGMTATAEIIVREVEDVFVVPNAALRFAPPVSTADNSGKKESFISKLVPGPPRHPKGAKQKNFSSSEKGKQIWILNDGQPTAVSVSLGATNGKVTEIRSDELTNETEVILSTLNKT